MLFSLILWVVIYCVGCILLRYCNDEPRYTNGKVLDLKMPSVLDLESTSDRHATNDYVKKVICPAHDYFNLDCDFQHDSTLRFITSVVVCFGSFMQIRRHLFVYLDQFEFFYDSESIVLPLVFSIAVAVFCILVYVAVYFLYEAKFTILQYPHGPDELQKMFCGSQFPISDQRAYENFVIEEYHHYLLRIKKSLERRNFLFKIISGLSVIIYFLFFYRGSYN